MRLKPWRFFLTLFLILLTFVICFIFSMSRAEQEPGWILCQPDSYVKVRLAPKRTGFEVGQLECGDIIYTDGKVKNGFLHCVDLSLESDEGWVYKGYIVFDEPHIPFIMDTVINSNGRVAARKTINGKRRCWLRDGQKIRVYMASEEWAVTNKGFIKTKFLEMVEPYERQTSNR